MNVIFRPHGHTVASTPSYFLSASCYYIFFAVFLYFLLFFKFYFVAITVSVTSNKNSSNNSNNNLDNFYGAVTWIQLIQGC